MVTVSITTVIGHLLCARRSKFSVHTNALGAYSNLTGVDTGTPFCGWRNCGLNSLSNPPELVSSAAEIQTQTV